MNYAHADGSGCPRPVDITNMRDDPANPVYICGCDPRQQPYTSDCGCVWPSYREWERGASGEKIWSCWTGDMGKVEPLTPTAPMADEDPDGRTLACPDCDYRNDGMPGLLWLHRVSEHGARRDPDAGTDRPPTPEPTESGTQCPPGVHSMFDPCPGDCSKDTDDDGFAERGLPTEQGETYSEVRARILREIREKLGEAYPDLQVVYYGKPYPTVIRPQTTVVSVDPSNGRGADARPARHTAWALPAAARKVKVDPAAHVCETSRCWQDCRNKDDLVVTYTDPGLTCIQPEPGARPESLSDNYANPALIGPGRGNTTEKGRRGIFAAIRRFWFWWTG